MNKKARMVDKQLRNSIRLGQANRKKHREEQDHLKQYQERIHRAYCKTRIEQINYRGRKPVSLDLRMGPTQERFCGTFLSFDQYRYGLWKLEGVSIRDYLLLSSGKNKNLRRGISIQADSNVLSTLYQKYWNASRHLEKLISDEGIKIEQRLGFQSPVLETGAGLERVFRERYMELLKRYFKQITTPGSTVKINVGLEFKQTDKV